MTPDHFTREDRKLLTRIAADISRINGTVSRHNEELFGNDRESGLLVEVSQLHDFRIKVETAVRTIMILLGLIGISNIILLFTVVGNQ